MREIKFRAYDTVGKKWLFGYDLPNLGGFSLIGEVVLLGQLNTVSLEKWRDISIMQFTGKKDKNGKEIYEGDLLSDPYPIDKDDLSKGYHEILLPVIWCNEKLRWSVDTSFAKDGTHLTSLVEYFGDELEVKGNVYEKGEAK